MDTVTREFFDHAEYVSRDGKRVGFVHPSTSAPGRLQVSRLDSDGPIGHVTVDTLADAVRVLGEYGIYPVAEARAPRRPLHERFPWLRREREEREGV